MCQRDYRHGWLRRPRPAAGSRHPIIWPLAAPLLRRSGPTAVPEWPEMTLECSPFISPERRKHAPDDQEYPVHHVRPVAVRLSVLHRPSAPRYPAHRCAGGEGRALQPRLCAVADLRRVAHVLLHRPLRAVARRLVERVPAQGRRDDARRLPAPARACDGAGRQDPHGARPRGHGAARHRSDLDHRRAGVGMRLRPVRARRRTACASVPTAATIRGGRATTTISTPRAMPATIPGTTRPTRRKARATGWPRAGRCAMPASPRASRRRIPRRPT